MGPEEIGTDEEGRFVMTGLPTGFEYVVHAKNETLTPFAGQAKVVCTASDGAAVDAGTIVVQRGRTVRGRVAGGREGMKIFLSTEYSFGTRVTRTDAEGRFVFEGVPAEPVSVWRDPAEQERITAEGDVVVELGNRER
ncbi:MAG TPA: hypothetical protein VF618_18560 [Thermoanaerobaculia bacterium]